VGVIWLVGWFAFSFWWGVVVCGAVVLVVWGGLVFCLIFFGCVVVFACLSCGVLVLVGWCFVGICFLGVCLVLIGSLCLGCSFGCCFLVFLRCVVGVLFGILFGGWVVLGVYGCVFVGYIGGLVFDL